MQRIIITSIIAVLVALGLAACGNTTTVVTKTVTPSPEPSPYLTAEEQEGLALIEDFTADLKHVYAVETNALDYGADTGNIVGVTNRADHYSSDYKELTRNYGKTNGGDYYGGRLDKLETLFEKASNNVRRFGLGIVNIALGGGNPTAIGEQSAYAQYNIDKVEAEILRLKSAEDTTGSF